MVVHYLKRSSTHSKRQALREIRNETVPGDYGHKDLNREDWPKRLHTSPGSGSNKFQYT